MAKKRSSSSKHWRYKHWGAIKLLVILGALVTITLAVYYMFRFPHLYIGIGTIPAWLWVVAWGILHLLISFVLLASTGVVDSKKWRVWCDWWLLFILGFIIVIPTSNWGGVIIVIAGVVGLFDRL